MAPTENVRKEQLAVLTSFLLPLLEHQAESSDIQQIQKEEALKKEFNILTSFLLPWLEQQAERLDFQQIQ